MRLLAAINSITRRFGFLVVLKPSAKMLNEHANVSEVHHPSRGGETVEWMRQVAEYACPGGDEYRR